MRQTLISAVAIAAIIALSATVSANDPEPLTLSAVSNRETCTLGSVTTIDYTIEGGVPPYRLTVDGREVATGTDPGLIRCNDSTIGSPFESMSAAGARYIAVNATDSVGNHVFKVVEVPLVPALSAPQNLHVISDLHWRSGTLFSVAWRVRHLPPIALREQVAIRWRKQGESDWTVELHQGRETMDLWYRASWQADTSSMGEQREVQAALIRHMLDLRTPDALQWTPTVTLTTAAPPHNLQAEATHNTITLNWGPHPPGLEYVASAQAIEVERYGYWQVQRVVSGLLNQARFEDLLPDTLYRVSVCLAVELGGRCWPDDEERFELRTERAPADWSSPTRSATDVTARLTDNELEVSWTPASTGARYDTRVCVKPSDHQHFAQCVAVAPGTALARLPFHIWSGGTFLVEVRTLSIPAGATLAHVHVPTYDSIFPTGGAPADAPMYSSMSSHIHPENPRPTTWTYSWEHGEAELAEVSWREDGMQILRERRAGWIDISPPRGGIPEAVRVRLLQDGVWTPWSAPAEAPSITRSLFPVRFHERADVLEVNWEAPEDDSDVTGYRLFVKRSGQPEETIDVGRQVSADILMQPTDETIEVSVAALIRGSTQVGKSWSNLHIQGELPPPPEISLSAEYSPCPPAELAPITVRWWVSAGTPPFTLWIGDRLGRETSERIGSTIVNCRIGTDGSFEPIPVVVIDAEGRTGIGSIDRYSFHYRVPEPGEDPGATLLGLRSVHRDHVFLSWECKFWPNQAVLRWRARESPDWNYVTDLPYRQYPDSRCRGIWQDLEPLTTYEYQLARSAEPDQLEHFEQVPWSELQTLTTLGPAQQLSVQRDGETVTVQWRRQPDAWAYVVGLRTEGRSWWKRYEPSGEAMETLRFFNIPERLNLEVELISPPLDYGREQLPQGFDYVALAGC